MNNRLESKFPFTNMQLEFVDEGTSSSQGIKKYKDRSGQEILPHLDKLSERGACRYMEFNCILVNLPKLQAIKVSCFEYDQPTHPTVQVEVLHPISIIAEADLGQDTSHGRYHCLSHIAYRLEQCYGITIGCNNDYQNLLPPIDNFLQNFSILQ